MLTNAETIFIPVFAQVLLTAVVWVHMYRTRIAKMKRDRIRPQDLADKQVAADLLREVAGPSDNFVNLFEIPILFYVATILAYITQTADTILLALFSAFVLFRAIHSIIQSTSNVVIRRFYVYVLSTNILWISWVYLAYLIFAAS